VDGRALPELEALFGQVYNKAAFDNALNSLRDAVVAEFSADDEALVSNAREAFEASVKKVVRRRILENGVRPDGRGLTDIRPIWCEVEVSPARHGSGLFTRGETQVMTLATLGTPREAQEMDSLVNAEPKRYIHHYNFPPFSTGEVRPLRGASRRDVGHGALVSAR